MDGSDMTTDSVPDGHKIIQEGLAKILYPADEDGDVPVSTTESDWSAPSALVRSSPIFSKLSPNTILGILQSGSSI